MIAAFGVGAPKQKAFNLVGGIERVTFFLVQCCRKTLQDPTNVSRVRSAALVDYVAEDKNLAGSKDICRTPVKCAPVDA